MQERVQVLYWLKTNQANSVGHLAALVGRHPTTVSRWLSKYRRGGLKALLTIESSPGRPATIPPFAIALLKEELSDPEGFSSYGEIQTWLETVCDVTTRAFPCPHSRVNVLRRPKGYRSA